MHYFAMAAITAVREMNRTIEDLETWMSSNRLRLEDPIICLGTHQSLHMSHLIAT